jgi:predicted transcriptional regulator YdeE
METIIIDKDIKVFYVNATSFPDGIMAAHQKLHSLLPYHADSRCFGLSRPENGGDIVYKAAIDAIVSGEDESLDLDTITVKKGNYACITINDYMKDMTAIGAAFRQLTALPNIDPQGYCVEWYLSDKDVKCMVRLAE